MYRSCLLALFICLNIRGQSGKEYELSTILFYNVENLFDTIDDPATLDDSRTPAGKYGWTAQRYRFKLDKIAEVIDKTGKTFYSGSADIIGLCEIENLGVLEDLVQHPLLKQNNYGIVHIDSPDDRGIDVCLLYRKARFLPTSFRSHQLVLYDPYPFRKNTRDQVVVAGLLDSEEIYFIVVHWPSRGGGEELTKPYRRAAAQLTCRILDSIYRETYDPRIVIMGDFNDNPPDESIQSILYWRPNLEGGVEPGFYNPMVKLYKKGIGSLAYRDRWSLFDQFIITRNLLVSEEKSYKFWRAGVYGPAGLLTRRGRFKGYPFRTYAAGIYQGGFSDHLPIYLHLIKEVTEP